ncbi:MAG TPA: thiamine pyrophosphate-dependent dehydrogenase E1 component subunit alpha [Aquabacterium sp.]|nr:thiamine pyrophosphate-dependent dehydrogenase E1 component subunit alpha [Aquabacterium sp.]HQC94750.1 thiamine pyrophosphate-dependent dehydrogenase E1 component subunit alpha [Aquabacterium sp.]
MTANTLGTLAQPDAHAAPIDITGEAPAQLLAQLRKLLLIRLVEQKLADRRKAGAIGGPVHLGVGQEAVAAGVSLHLRSSDRVFGAHRSHAHLLALGSDVRRLFAEVLGRDTGLSRGMGGSMHLWDQPRGFYGSVPIVAGTVPLAVGAALAAQLQGVSDVAVAYLGDGAVEEGVVHESLNLASRMKLPVVFVVENNLFASHMHISLRQPDDGTVRFAHANCMASALVDGNDVVAVARAAGRLVADARAGGGPGFLEAVTYRWLGHVDWRDDIDVGVQRSADEVAQWRLRDPVARLEAALRSGGHWSDAQGAALRDDLQAHVDAAWEQAMADPVPPPSALMSRVYAGQGQ